MDRRGPIDRLSFAMERTMQESCCRLIKHREWDAIRWWETWVNHHGGCRFKPQRGEKNRDA